MYKDFLTFDIECSNIDEIKQSYMYIWQIYILGDYIIGRTYEQLQYTYAKISDFIENKLIVFVHNLSYEFAFIREAFEWDDVMVTRAHTVLKCSTFNDKIEFRCSYLLTNMSLAQFTARMGVTNKLSGDLYNYDKIRLHNTKMSRYEMSYALVDVKGLHEGLSKFIHEEGETLYTLPYTSTGFVRRELKKELLFTLGRKYGLRHMLHPEQYKLLRRAYRGGNTHANRFYVNQTLHYIAGFDIKSSYPYQLLNFDYPDGKYSAIYTYTEEEMEKIVNNKKLCMVMYLYLTDVRLKDIYNPCPYIPFSKTLKGSCKDYVLDNGRLLRASELQIAVTEVDYHIIKAQYEFNIEGIKGMVCKRKPLPKPYKDIVMKYFKKKCDIDKHTDAYGYARSKEKLNAIYGVTVTDVCKPTIIYEDGEFILETLNMEEELLKNAKKNPLLYCVGVYVSAYARKELQDIINLVGDDFRYCDTDSVKCARPWKYKPLIDNYNNRIAKSIKTKGYDYKGQILGTWEIEDIYIDFRMLGAKKYAYTVDGKLHIVIAGVSKSGAEELKSIDNLTPGFTFEKNGGVEGRYNDYYGKYSYKGVEIEIRENLYLHKHDYTVGYGKDYKALIESILCGEYEYIFER